MYWTSNIYELFKPILIIQNNMNMEEKLNTLNRFILFSGILIALLFNNTKIVAFIIILLLLSIIVYNYYIKNKDNKESFLNTNNLDIINNKLCIAPTKNNPLMNRNVLDNNCKNDIETCTISNKKVKNKIDKILNHSLSNDTYNIYGKNNLFHIFYNMPNNNNPNNRDLFMKWLYKDPESCKDEGGIACYNNLHNDLRDNL